MRAIIGFLIAFFAFVAAFGMVAGGGHGLTDMLGKINFWAAMGLVHVNEVFAIGGVILGGLLVAFRSVDLFALLVGCCTRREPPPKELRTNLLICQAGSRLSLFAGMAASVAGVIVVTMYYLGGDTHVVGQGIATAMTGALWGILLAALFNTLKSRFLHKMKPGS